jgi:hypothetical protein
MKNTSVIAVGKRSGTEDRVLVGYIRGETQSVYVEVDAVVMRSLEITDGQRIASTVLDERLVFSVTVGVGIVMLLAFMYWAYAISLVAF